MWAAPLIASCGETNSDGFNSAMKPPVAMARAPSTTITFSHHGNPPVSPGEGVGFNRTSVLLILVLTTLSGSHKFRPPLLWQRKIALHHPSPESLPAFMASSIHAQDPHSYAVAPICRQAASRRSERRDRRRGPQPTRLAAPRPAPSSL